MASAAATAAHGLSSCSFSSAAVAMKVTADVAVDLVALAVATALASLFCCFFSAVAMVPVAAVDADANNFQFFLTSL